MVVLYFCTLLAIYDSPLLHVKSLCTVCSGGKVNLHYGQELRIYSVYFGMAGDDAKV